MDGEEPSSSGTMVVVAITVRDPLESVEVCIGVKEIGVKEIDVNSGVELGTVIKKVVVLPLFTTIWPPLAIILKNA